MTKENTYLVSPSLHLKSDMAKSPVINLQPIKWVPSNDNLGCSIRPSTNTFPTVFSAINTGLAAILDHTNTKICDLNISVKVNEHIFWFDIAMDYPYAVEGRYTHDLRNISLWEDFPKGERGINSVPSALEAVWFPSREEI